MSKPLLSINHLAKSYRDGVMKHQILQDIDLQVKSGERIAIVGRSGCGKTTLLNLIAGLDQPDSGSILIDEDELTAMDEKQRTLIRRERIGMVFQFFNLLPTLTVLENILLPLELTAKPISKTAMLETLETVGLAEQQHRFPEQLSGGELQRVAILRAISHRPRLLLADEPTGNLDHETGNQIAELLYDTVTQESALIVVTHSRELAAKADCVYQLQDGLLTRMDTHA